MFSLGSGSLPSLGAQAQSVVIDLPRARDLHVALLKSLSEQAVPCALDVHGPFQSTGPCHHPERFTRTASFDVGVMELGNSEIQCEEFL